MFHLNEKGNLITYVIVAMSMIAALAVGAFYLTSSAAIGEIGANNLNRAYVLALAGKDYAVMSNLGSTAGADFTLANGDRFSLVVNRNCPGTPDTIESTGIVSPGMPFEARRKIIITQSCP
jgi:hypothetical protein